MKGSQLRKGWKHWRKSPPGVCLDKGLYRNFLDSPTFDLASPKAIQTQAIITSKLKIEKNERRTCMKKALWITMIVVFSVLFAFTASQAKPFKIAAIFQTAIGNRGMALSIRPVSKPKRKSATSNMSSQKNCRS